jgi:hypothetical protein
MRPQLVDIQESSAGISVIFIIFCGMSLAPLNRFFPYSFGRIDLASRYGGGEQQATARRMVYRGGSSRIETSWMRPILLRFFLPGAKTREAETRLVFSTLSNAPSRMLGQGPLED